ncbi:MAG: SymE family type I addiction module toxin [Cyclobacteriaceae bacterium]|nr:SymE family type I addiction module toxin [Cyclobacteriaceae bacterium HetDA_MAG_MS6]
MIKQDNRKLRICSKYRYNQEVPELRLTGHWFKELGFGIGDRVSIITREKLSYPSESPVRDSESPEQKLSLLDVYTSYS